MFTKCKKKLRSLWSDSSVASLSHDKHLRLRLGHLDLLPGCLWLHRREASAHAAHSLSPSRWSTGRGGGRGCSWGGKDAGMASAPPKCSSALSGQTGSILTTECDSGVNSRQTLETRRSVRPRTVGSRLYEMSRTGDFSRQRADQRLAGALWGGEGYGWRASLE